MKSLIKEFGLDSGNGTTTPGASDGKDGDGQMDEFLGKEGTTMYRRGAARLNDLSLDRPD